MWKFAIYSKWRLEWQKKSWIRNKHLMFYFTLIWLEYKGKQKKMQSQVVWYSVVGVALMEQLQNILISVQYNSELMS